jgi:hypothetical protein
MGKFKPCPKNYASSSAVSQPFSVSDVGLRNQTQRALPRLQEAPDARVRSSAGAPFAIFLEAMIVIPPFDSHLLSRRGRRELSQ